MRMKLVGMTAIREGISRKKEEEYCYQTLHFNGKNMDVQGIAVASVMIDYVKMNNLPPFKLGNLYDLDLSDRGYLRNIELLEECNSEEAPQPGAAG